MKRTYLQLFQIQLQHQYYKEGFAKALTLDPDRATLQLMRKFDLVWRKASDGVFVMLYGVEAGQPSPLAQLGSQYLAFRFELQSTNPYFINFTKLDFEKFSTHQLYFSNIQPVPNTDGNLLSQTTIVGDKDLLPLQTPVFNHQVSTKSILSIRDCFGNKLPVADNAAGLPTAESDSAARWVLLPPVPADDPNAPDDIFQVNIQQFPSGKYALETAPDQFYWFYKAETSVQPVPPLGIVEIYAGKTDAQMLPLPGTDPAANYTSRQFKVQFEALATRWRYHLILQNEIDLASMKIESTDGQTPVRFQIDSNDLEEITFKSDERGWHYLVDKNGTPEETKLEPVIGSQLGMTVTASSDLLLQENYETNLRLRINTVKQGEILINLPVPDGRTINRVGKGADRQQLYADMYVYL